MSSEKECFDQNKISTNDRHSTRTNRIERYHSPVPQKEIFHTVVVNYNIGKKEPSLHKPPIEHASLNAINSNVENNTPQKSDEDIYNLRKLYQTSLDELSTSKVFMNANVCEPKTPAIIENSKDNQKDTQNHIRVEIYNAPPLQVASSENYPKITSHDLRKNIFKTSSDHSKISNSSSVTKPIEKEPAAENVKVEIFNMPPIQKTKTEVIVPNNDNVLAKDNEVIVISNDEDDSSSSVNEPELVMTGIVPDQHKIVDVLQKLVEAAQSTCELCASVSKSVQGSSQRPEKQHGVPTQMPDHIITNDESIQAPSSIKSTKKSKLETFRKRQKELHQLRVQIEKKRLKLLNLEIKRKQDAIKRDKFLFEKKVAANTSMLIKPSNDECDL